MKKYYVAILCIILANFAHCESPLFVSLGSVCEVTHALRESEVRSEAYPFDWITSFDSEKFLEILEQDFEFFLDENLLYVGNRGPGPLIHSYYHLEFLHEGDFRGSLYAPNFEKFKLKYQRRIDRFRSLAEYQGKVYFLRTAYQYSTTDPHRYYHCADNLEINEEYAWRLFHILQKLFPKLDFTLIIINNDHGDGVREEKKLDNHLIMVKSNPWLDPAIRYKSYKQYFDTLFNVD